MIRHIVMWNLKDEAEGHDKAYNAQKIKEGLEGLVGKIDGLLKAEVGANVNPSGGVDLCLYSEFTSLEALNAYRINPLHKEVQKFVHAVITDRVSNDSEW